MLHGANFVHCYGRQYSLANSFHIIVPHIMGFGDEAGRIFYTDTCCAELVNMIRSLNKKFYWWDFHWVRNLLSSSYRNIRNYFILP